LVVAWWSPRGGVLNKPKTKKWRDEKRPAQEAMSLNNLMHQVGGEFDVYTQGLFGF